MWGHRENLGGYERRGREDLAIAEQGLGWQALHSPRGGELDADLEEPNRRLTAAPATIGSAAVARPVSRGCTV